MNKSRLLNYLAGAVAILVLAAILVDIHGRRWAMRQHGPGTRLVAEFDTAKIDRIELSDGLGRLVIEKTSQDWVIRNRSNYPASTPIVEDFLHRFRDAKVLQRVNAPATERASLCLETPGAKKTGAGLLASVYKGNSLQAEMLWGLPVADPAVPIRPENPQGSMIARYVMMPRTGLVALAADSFDSFTMQPGAWMDHGLWQLGKPKAIRLLRDGNIVWQIARATPDKAYEMTPALASEKLHPDAMNQLGAVLALATFTDVVDPTLQDADTGLDHPAICEIEDFSGRRIAYHFGKRFGDAENGRVYTRIVRDSSVPGSVPAERLKHWVFAFDPKIVGILAGRREQFLAKPAEAGKDQ